MDISLNIGPINFWTITVALIVLGYITGTIVEARHYRSIKNRERKLLPLPIVTLAKILKPNDEVEKVQLVTGNVVISLDYFKRVVAGLRNFLGGKLRTYETLLDRARREAILRMKEKATGSDIILNVRLETSSIGGSASERKTIGCFETIAYGSAVTFRKKGEIYTERTNR